MITDHLKTEVFNLIKAKDAEEGESWSNDTGAIADLILEFHDKRSTMALETITKGTRNRRYYKGWESRLIEILEGKE